jgi:hypothetical protein
VRDQNRRGTYERYDRAQQQQLQRERWNQYNSRWQNWNRNQELRRRQLEQQRRLAYLRYQQRYWERLRRDQLRLQQARYYDYLINNYRYNRGGNYYYTSQYGAQMLEQAIQYGYEEGYRSGMADRQDGWGYDYMNAFGYQDASYGYDSYYVGLDEYNYYFREGFRRGYEDGFYGRYEYGRYTGGRYEVLGAIVQSILNLIVD